MQGVGVQQLLRVGSQSFFREKYPSDRPCMYGSLSLPNNQMGGWKDQVVMHVIFVVSISFFLSSYACVDVNIS
jgi:hypothetical protein